MTKNNLSFYMLALCAVAASTSVHAGKKLSLVKLCTNLDEDSVNTTRTDCQPVSDRKLTNETTYAAITASGKSRPAQKNKPHSEKRQQGRSYSTTQHLYPWAN